MRLAEGDKGNVQFKLRVRRGVAIGVLRGLYCHCAATVLLP